jgi:hypothetical protein
MGDRKATSFCAAAIVGGDQAEKQIALFNSGDAVIKGRTVRKNWDGPLMRHPDFIPEYSQQGIYPVKKFFDTIDGGRDHDDEFSVHDVLCAFRGGALVRLQDIKVLKVMCLVHRCAQLG